MLYTIYKKKPNLALDITSKSLLIIYENSQWIASFVAYETPFKFIKNIYVNYNWMQELKLLPL